MSTKLSFNADIQKGTDVPVLVEKSRRNFLGFKKYRLVGIAIK